VTAQTSSIVVPADVRYLEAVCSFVSRIAAIAGMDKEDIHRLEVAVDEACTNVVRHGYDSDASQSYTVSCGIETGVFTVEVLERGKPFDFGSLPEPDLNATVEDRPIGGLGMVFIRKLVDDVRFSVEPDGLKRLRLLKRLPVPAENP
jgi:serine/threonine-protein kinase RsbW